MATIKHTFVSGIPDGPNTNRLQPSHWNAEHEIVDGNKFGDVANGNFSEFEADGTVKFNGTSTTWRDYTGQVFPQVSSPVMLVKSVVESFTKIAGGALTGTTSSTYAFDGDALKIMELSGANPLTVDFEFTDLTRSSNIFITKLEYDGSETHNVKLEVANVSAGAYTGAYTAVTADASDFGASTIYSDFAFKLANHTNYYTTAGKIKFRIRHIDTGINSHYLKIAELAIAREVHVPMLEPIASTQIRALEFPGTDTAHTAISGSIEIDHAIKEGSNIFPHCHWFPTTTTVGDVKLYLEYAWINAFGTVASSSTIYLTAAAGGTAWQEKRNNFDSGQVDWAGLSGVGKGIGGRFLYRFYRDPNDVADTYPDSILLYDVQVHAESDTLGSRTVTSK